MTQFKLGQSVRHRDRWATLLYLVSPGQALITYDDDSTVLVLERDLSLQGQTNATCDWCGEKYWAKKARRNDNRRTYCCHNHGSLHWNFLHRRRTAGASD